MKLRFKQKVFSWLGSSDVYSETGEIVYTIKGQMAWGHCLNVFDTAGREVGMVKERVMSFFPRFEIYVDGNRIGEIRKEFSFFKPRFTIDYMDWHVEGSFTEWDYRIYNGSSMLVASLEKEIFNWTDTYSIDVVDPEDALAALMLTVAIDAEKCSREH